VPDWFPVDKFDIDIAERLIEYQKKMPELSFEDSSKKKPKTTKKTNQRGMRKELHKPSKKEKN
jgi:hypothetical protein